MIDVNRGIFLVRVAVAAVMLLAGSVGGCAAQNPVPPRDDLGGQYPSHG